MTNGLATEALPGESARLRPTSDATTVQVRDGEVLISEGRFAETRRSLDDSHVRRRPASEVQTPSAIPSWTSGHLDPAVRLRPATTIPDELSATLTLGFLPVCPSLDRNRAGVGQGFCVGLLGKRRARARLLAFVLVMCSRAAES
jgi:hypothetical protein